MRLCGKGVGGCSAKRQRTTAWGLSTLLHKMPQRIGHESRHELNEFP